MATEKKTMKELKSDRAVWFQENTPDQWNRLWDRQDLERKIFQPYRYAEFHFTDGTELDGLIEEMGAYGWLIDTEEHGLIYIQKHALKYIKPIDAD